MSHLVVPLQLDPPIGVVEPGDVLSQLSRTCSLVRGLPQQKMQPARDTRFGLSRPSAPEASTKGLFWMNRLPVTSNPRVACWLVLRLLIDTSTWLDLAGRRAGQQWIVPLRVLKHEAGWSCSSLPS
jgi:hypothetical protein